MSVKYQLNLRRPLVPVLAGVDCVPSYFIVGGLVFVPLSIPFLEHAYGGEPSSLPICPPAYPLIAELSVQPASRILQGAGTV